VHTWFFLATATAFLYAVINHIDSTILENYLEESGSEVLLLFSCLFAAFGIPYAAYMDPTVLDIFSAKAENVGIMVTVAILNTSLLWCYLKALDNDNPTVVVLYYQLVPIATLGIGYLVLGETISSNEALAMSLILIGTTFAGFRKSDDGEISFRWLTFGLMVLATTFWAIEMTISKIVILDESVYHSVFWESVLMTVTGIVIFVVKPKYRNLFKKVWKVNSKPILGLMVTGELIYAIGNTMSAHASELKEVALVMLSQPIQTVFVFLIGIGLAFVFPSVYKRPTTSETLQLLIAIIVTGAGTFLLFI
jgi:drug/metabolite transporter (DMT)-like permease